MKSGPRTEATKAIHAFIQEHQPVTPAALAKRFRSEANAAGMAVTTWLLRRMANMEAAGFVQHGPTGWTAKELPAKAPRPADEVRRHQRPRAEKPQAPAETSIAEPRRVSMFGPAYTPPPQVHRSGADDYASLPSVFNGQPRPYRSAW